MPRRLTPRQSEILKLVALGKHNQEIANLLGVSICTVATHRANFMQVLDLHTPVEVTLYAVRNRIVTF